MAAELAQLTARMRHGETIRLRDTAKTVVALSLPSILEQAVMTVMEYIDAAMVGHLGAAATASIGIVSSTTWLFHGIMIGVATGFAVQIAQYLGGKREAEARGVLRQAILINLLFGALFAAIGLGLCRSLPVWLGAQESIRSDAASYFGIWSAAAPLYLAISLYSAVLRCSGDTRTPSLLNALMCPLDVGFNYLLINPSHTVTLLGHEFVVWGAGLGVRGAALGTAAATAIASAIMLCIVIFRPGPLCLARSRGSWRFTKTCLSNACKVGIPVSAERAALSSAQVILVRVVAALGTVSIAANSLAVNAEAMCYLSGYGIEAAALALVGQAIGAGRKDIAKQFAWLCTGLGIALMGLSGIVLYLAAPALMAIFTADTAVIALGAGVLRIEAFAEPLFGASIVASGAMQGAGDARAPFLINLCSMWGIRVTAATLLAPRFGLYGVWAAMCGELCLRGLFFLIRLAHGKWLKKGALN